MEVSQSHAGSAASLIEIWTFCHARMTAWSTTVNGRLSVRISPNRRVL